MEPCLRRLILRLACFLQVFVAFLTTLEATWGELPLVPQAIEGCQARPGCLYQRYRNLPVLTFKDCGPGVGGLFSLAAMGHTSFQLCAVGTQQGELFAESAGAEHPIGRDHPQHAPHLSHLCVRDCIRLFRKFRPNFPLS